MSPYGTVHLKTICSECEILENRLKDATNSIVKIADNTFKNPEQRSQQLSKALDEREHVLRNYLEHLNNHSHATAA